MAGDHVIVMIKGNVKSVDASADTCVVTPIDGGPDYLDVKLEAVDNAGGDRSDVIRYPKVGCDAIIGLINNQHNDTFLIKASAYDSVVITVAQKVVIKAHGNGLVEISASKITINGGSNKGLVNVQPLVTKISNLEKKVNSFLSVFKAHKHLGVSTGGGVSGITNSTTPGSISPVTKKADLEDTKILH